MDVGSVVLVAFCNFDPAGDARDREEAVFETECVFSFPRDGLVKEGGERPKVD